MSDSSDEVDVDFDAETGRLTLCCGQRSFERLRDSIWKEANVGTLFTYPSGPVRSLLVELQPELDAPREGWAYRLGWWGCLFGLLGLVVVFGIGVLTIVRWLAQ
jgi:hypothetical protein